LVLVQKIKVYFRPSYANLVYICETLHLNYRVALVKDGRADIAKEIRELISSVHKLRHPFRMSWKMVYWFVGV